jgi:hypothetical protein
MSDVSQAAGPRASRFLLHLTASLILAAAAYGILPSERLSAAGWKGWGRILVRPGPSEAEALRALEDAGVAPVWSESSQTVHISDFVDSRRVSLEQALKRLIPGDPRRTPWMEGLSGYFRAQDGELTWSILYIPAASGSRASRALSKALSPADWKAAEGAGPGGPGLSWIPGAALCGYWAYTSRRRKWLVPAAALPWLPLWLSGRLAAAFGGIWGFLILLIFIEDSGGEPGSIRAAARTRRSLRFLPQALVLVLPGILDPSYLPGLGLSLGSSVCLILGFERLEIWKACRRVHGVFRGIPLDIRRLREDQDRRLSLGSRAAIAACLAVLGVRGILPELPRDSLGGDSFQAPLPMPGPVIAPRFPDARAVERLLRERTEPGLPTLADAVAHRAYQEALPYSRIGTRAYGSLEAVTLERFSPEGAQVVRTRETVAEFDDPWVRKALQEEAETGIGAVLADQGGIVNPRAGYPRGDGISGSLALRDVFFYIIFLAPALLGTAGKGIRLPIHARGIARAASRR